MYNFVIKKTITKIGNDTEIKMCMCILLNIYMMNYLKRRE